MTPPPLEGDELPILVGGSASEPERLLLVSRPSTGVVRVREWTSADWAASPTMHEAPAEALLLELEQAFHRRRSLNQALGDIRAWLLGTGKAQSP